MSQCVLRVTGQFSGYRYTFSGGGLVLVHFLRVPFLVLTAGLEAMLKKSTRRKRQSRNEHTTHDEADKVVCEFYTAAVEAVACGARVLLGDRDFKVCDGVQSCSTRTSRQAWGTRSHGRIWLEARRASRAPDTSHTRNGRRMAQGWASLLPASGRAHFFLPVFLLEVSSQPVGVHAVGQVFRFSRMGCRAQVWVRDGPFRDKIGVQDLFAAEGFFQRSSSFVSRRARV